jgi:riboflavin synthase
MFTGIVQGKANIKSIFSTENFNTFTIEFPVNALEGIQRGASVAINGTCLTVTEFDYAASWAKFDVIDETLARTNLGSLVENSAVNYERSAKFGDEVGGHIMSGHIQCATPLLSIKKTINNYALELKTPVGLLPYLLTKGYVGLNGCSLTLGEVTDNSFWIHLIPETLNLTTFGDIDIDGLINVEIDSQTQAIVDTVERYMSLKKNVVSRLSNGRR